MTNTTNLIDFRLLASEGMPIFFMYGTTVGESLADIFLNALKNENIFSIKLCVNNKQNISYLDIVKKNKPNVICLDTISSMMLDYYYCKVNIYYNNPYDLNSFKNNKKNNICILHNSICNSISTYCANDYIRRSTQLRHSNFINILPQVPSIRSKQDSKNANTLLYISDPTKVRFLDDLIKYLQVNNPIIIIPDYQNINMYDESENLEKIKKETDLFMNFNLPNILYSIGPDFVSYPGLRLQDILYSNVLNINFKFNKQTNLKPNCPGYFIKSLNDNYLKDEEINSISNMINEDYIKKITLKAQKDFFINNISFVNWLKSIFNLD